MKGAFFILWFTLSVLAGTALFYTSDKVQKAREETARLENSIVEEKESLRVLKAEWAYLNQPERLEKLAAEHLDLVPTKGQQLSDINRVPEHNKESNPLLSQAPVTKRMPVQKIISSYAPVKPIVTAPVTRSIPKKSEAPRDFGALLQTLGAN